jgi:hypothetical protein
MFYIHLHFTLSIYSGLPPLTIAIQYKKNYKQVFKKLMRTKKWIYKVGKWHVLYRVAKKKYFSFECVLCTWKTSLG